MTKQRFASLTAGLLARKGEAAPPVAMFNKAAAKPESPAQFDDVSPEMQERIDSIVTNPNAPSNWTHPPVPIDMPSESLDLESEYDMDDQRHTKMANGVPMRHGLLSRPGGGKEKPAENALFARMTPMSAPQFGRRKDVQNDDGGQIVSMHPKKNQEHAEEEWAETPEENIEAKQETIPAHSSEENRTLIISRARAPSIRRTAITFRLDEERYLRLKYAGAQLGKTSQAILESALDRYLVSLGDKFTHDAEWLRQAVSIVPKGKRS